MKKVTIFRGVFGGRRGILETKELLHRLFRKGIFSVSSSRDKLQAEDPEDGQNCTM